MSESIKELAIECGLKEIFIEKANELGIDFESVTRKTLIKILKAQFVIDDLENLIKLYDDGKITAEKLVKDLEEFISTDIVLNIEGYIMHLIRHPIPDK